MEASTGKRPSMKQVASMVKRGKHVPAAISK
jgi:hypothetical protein